MSRRDPFYGTAAWRRLRAAVLKRDVLCTSGGCKRASVVADHVVPRTKGGPDTMENLRGLCTSCHSRITAGADGGFGNALRRARAVAAPGCDASGQPTAPTHWWNSDD